MGKIDSACESDYRLGNLDCETMVDADYASDPEARTLPSEPQLAQRSAPGGTGKPRTCSALAVSTVSPSGITDSRSTYSQRNSGAP